MKQRISQELVKQGIRETGNYQINKIVKFCNILILIQAFHDLNEDGTKLKVIELHTFIFTKGIFKTKQELKKPSLRP